MKKMFFLLLGSWMLAGSVYASVNFDVRYIGDDGAKLTWTESTGDLHAFRFIVTESENPGDPTYWKNVYTTNENEQVVTGLAAEHQYYVYMQGGEDDTHFGSEVFVWSFMHHANIAPCGLYVWMSDVYADSWNNGYLEIKGSGFTTQIELENGLAEGWAQFIADENEVVTISWHRGDYDNEIRFIIYSGDGEEIWRVDNASTLSDGQKLYEGKFCTAPCAVEVMNLDFTSSEDKKEYYVTWDATGADSYQVAVVQKMFPTDEELEKAAKATTSNTYTIKGKANAIYHVYVRAICDEGKKGKWTELTICDPLSSSGAVKDILPAISKNIKLNYTEKGDFYANAVGIGSSKTSWNSATGYHLVLAEKTTLLFEFTATRRPCVGCFMVFKDPGDGSEFIMEANIYGSTCELEAGDHYIMFMCLSYPDEYTLKISKYKEPKVTEITELNFREAGSFYNAPSIPLENYYTVPGRIFRYQAPEDENVLVQVNRDNPTCQVVCIIYKDTIQSSSSLTSLYADGRATLTFNKGQVYYFVVADLIVSGTGTELSNYEFLVSRQSDEPTQAKRITLDAHLHDSFGKDDVVNELGRVGKVYEFVLKEDTRLAYSVELLGDRADDEDAQENLILEIYQYEVNSSNLKRRAYGSDVYFGAGDVLTGSSIGTHYYAVVFNVGGVNTEYLLDIRQHGPASEIKGTERIEVNTNYRSTITAQDAYRRDGEGLGNTTSMYGSFDAYTVYLEAGKRYMIMSHVLRDESTIRHNFFGITVLDPKSSGTTFAERTVSSTSSFIDDWNVITDFQPTKSQDYTVVFGTPQDRKFRKDSVAYEFAVQQVTYVEYAYNDAPLVELPYKESGVLKNNRMVVPSTTYGFMDNPSTYIESEGAYDAVPVRVNVAAGDSLCVEFGGDADVAIYIYLGGGSTPTIIDKIPYAYPYERGGIKNTSSTEKEYYVLAAFKQPRVTDAPYTLRISNHSSDFTSEVVTAKVNQSSVTIYDEDGIAAAQEALGKLKLTAVKGSTTVSTITNCSYMWNVDLGANRATYVLNDSDLPVGYTFGKPNVAVQVSIKRQKHVAIEEVIVSSERDDTVQKVLRNGQVLIITPYGTFDMFGRRVE